MRRLVFLLALFLPIISVLAQSAPPVLGSYDSMSGANAVIERPDGHIFVRGDYAIRTNTNGEVIQWVKIDCPTSLTISGQSFYCGPSLVLGDEPTPTPGP